MHLVEIGSFLIFQIVLSPPQITLALHICEYCAVISSSLSYFTKLVIDLINEYFSFSKILLICEQIIFVCINGLEGTLTIFALPDKSPKINEKAKFTGTFDGAI